MKRIFLFFYFCGIGFSFPLYFTFFSRLIRSLFAISYLGNPNASKQRFVPTLSCLSFDTCTRWHPCADVCVYAYAYTGEERKCKRRRWWFFAPRIRTALPRVGTNWVFLLFSFIPLCGFHSFNSCVFMSMWRECYRRHMLIFNYWIQNLFLSMQSIFL